jgi:hypothetical protein
MRRGYGRELAIGDFMNAVRIKISGPRFRRPPSRMMQLFHLAVNPLLLNSAAQKCRWQQYKQVHSATRCTVNR